MIDDQGLKVRHTTHIEILITINRLYYRHKIYYFIVHKILF